MLRSLRFVSLAVLAAASLLAACACDPDGDPVEQNEDDAGPDGGDDSRAVFADASDLELMRALQSAAGGDALNAMTIGSLFSQRDEPAGCPVIASEGAVTTVTAGCTDVDGARIEGSLLLDNVPPILSGDPDVDPDGLRHLVADDFSLVGPEGRMTIDGTAEVEPVHRIAATALRFEVHDLLATSDVEWICDDTELCTASAASTIELDGVGRATVEGARRIGEPRAGTVTLHGADDVTFDIAASTADCVPYHRSNGTSGQACDLAP